MIYNYLDYVKGQRKNATELMIQYHRQSREDSTRWGQGFYAGHAQARSFEARHWRRLQKDIEACLKTVGETHCPACVDVILNKFDF